jgi:glycosyltransferase involved in cell wall biosynthesis
MSPTAATPEHSPSLLYLTWGEVIVYDGLFNNQVLEQLKQIRKQDGTLPMHLLSGIPVGNRYLVKRSANFYSEIAKIRAQLIAAHIGFSQRLIPAVARWFHSKPYQFPVYTVGQMGALARLIRGRGINIIHCRSYHATRLALLTKKRYQLNCRVIFDTRGMFPEEAVLAGYFTQESPAYRRWKAEEQWLFDEADAVVNVSATFTEYVASCTHNPNLHTIATSTNLALFQPNPAERQSQRQQLQIAERTKVLVYLGSLGTKHGWHNIANLLAVFRIFRQQFPESILLIVTRSPQAPLVAALQEVGYGASDYLLTTANSPQETSNLLQAGDYAALTYYNVGNALEAQVGKTVIASKSGEYLGVGLPMIVNRTAGAAARLVAQAKIGAVYNGGDEAAIGPALMQIAANYAAVSANCVRVAQEHFSAEGNARKYLALYRQLLGADAQKETDMAVAVGRRHNDANT